MHTAVYGQEEGKSVGLGCPISTERLLHSVSMGQLMVDQLVVGTTGWATLGISLMKPEPHNSSVVFLACGEFYYD